MFRNFDSKLFRKLSKVFCVGLVFSVVSVSNSLALTQCQAISNNSCPNGWVEAKDVKGINMNCCCPDSSYMESGGACVKKLLDPDLGGDIGGGGTGTSCTPAGRSNPPASNCGCSN
jgi:hypothetical protein